MASPQQNETQFDLPNLGEDLGNLDDLDWSFLSETPNPANFSANSNDDPFGNLLPSQSESDSEISEAEFFDMVALDEELVDPYSEADTIYSDSIDNVQSQFNWGSEDDEDLTSILSPKDLLAKLRAEDEFENQPETNFQDPNQYRLKEIEELDLPEFDWNADQEEENQYTSFLNPEQIADPASFDQSFDQDEIGDQILEGETVSSIQDRDPFNLKDLSELTDLPELESTSEFDWNADEAEADGQYTSLLSAEQLTADEVFAELDAALGLELTSETESSFSEWDREVEEQESFDLENELANNLSLEQSSDQSNFPIPNSLPAPNLISDSQLRYSEDFQPQSNPAQELIPNPMPKSTLDQIPDSSILDFEDPEDLDEEILLSVTAPSFLPDILSEIDHSNLDPDNEIAMVQNLDYPEMKSTNISQLPDLGLGIDSESPTPLDDFELDQLKETFTTPLSNRTLIPTPTKSADSPADISSEEEAPDYLAGFSQEFVKSTPKPESLPSLPSLPLPPLPQISPTPTHVLPKPANPIQAVAQISVNQIKKSTPKPGEDENEQDWLDSFDEIANDMEWEELQGVKATAKPIPKDDTPTSFVSSTRKPTSTAINPSIGSANFPTQKLSNPPSKTESSSKSADIFSIEDDSMEWTAILDSDTDFVKEIANIQEQKKGSSNRDNVREQSPSVELNNRFNSSPSEPRLASNPLKNFRKPDIDWKKYQQPLAIAGTGLASFILIFGVFGRFTLENGLKIGLFKDAQAKDLKGANLKGGNLERANLRQANLNGANLEGANLRGAILSEADLRGANIKGANLRGAKLNGMKLELASKKGASKIDPPDLLMWQLVNVPRAGRNLSGANLDGFNLDSANLRSANLSRAKLSWVNFENASLNGANLTGADISGASFVNTNLNGANFSSTKWGKDRVPKTDNSTTCPNGKKGPCKLR